MVLDINSSLQMALIHSPSYQQQLETIYLSALDVSTERFRFEIQFFGGNTTRFDHLGRLAGIGTGLQPGARLGRRREPVSGRSNNLRTSTDVWMQKQFATAGELAVGFANSIVWTFAGPDTNATGSLLNMNLVQPLLRGAGKDIALEQLTIVERNLLANLRAFQRYRQGFYTQVAVGELGVSGPSRRGGFFGGTGLTGFTGKVPAVWAVSARPPGSAVPGSERERAAAARPERAGRRWCRHGRRLHRPAATAAADPQHRRQPRPAVEPTGQAGGLSRGRPDHADPGRQPAAEHRDGASEPAAVAERV